MLNYSSSVSAQRQFIDTIVTHVVTHQRSVSDVERKRSQAAKRHSDTNHYFKRLNSNKPKQSRKDRLDQLHVYRAGDMQLTIQED